MPKTKKNDARVAAYIRRLAEMSANGMTPLDKGGPTVNPLTQMQYGKSPKLAGDVRVAESPMLSSGGQGTFDIASILSGLRRSGIMEAAPTKFPQTDSSRAMADINRMILDTGAIPQPQQQLPADLLDLLGGGEAPVVNEEELRAEALRRVEQMLNPQIEALQGQMGIARENTGRAKSDIDIIYDLLKNELGASSKEQSAELAKANQMGQEAYGSALKDISGNYGSSIDELAKAITAGGGDASVVAETVGRDLTGDKAFLEGLTRGDQAFAKEQGQTLASQLENFNQQVIGQTGATKAGKMTAADRQLNELLNQITGQISGLQGQKGTMVEDMMAQLMGAQQSAQDSELERQLKQLQIAKGVGDLNYQGLQGRKLEQEMAMPPKSPEQELGYANAMQYLGQAGPEYQQTFNELFASGDFDSRDEADTIKKLAELAKKRNLDPNVMINAWMRYAKQY